MHSGLQCRSKRSYSQKRREDWSFCQGGHSEYERASNDPFLKSNSPHSTLYLKSQIRTTLTYSNGTALTIPLIAGRTPTTLALTCLVSMEHEPRITKPYQVSRHLRETGYHLPASAHPTSKFTMMFLAMGFYCHAHGPDNWIEEAGTWSNCPEHRKRQRTRLLRAIVLFSLLFPALFACKIRRLSSVNVCLYIQSRKTIPAAGIMGCQDNGSPQLRVYSHMFSYISAILCLPLVLIGKLLADAMMSTTLRIEFGYGPS